jgi:hypothetical protein
MKQDLFLVKLNMSQRGTILVCCSVDQPLDVGNDSELRADKMSVRAGHLLRENLYKRAAATWTHRDMAHVGQLAADKIVQCCELVRRAD